MSGLVLEDVTIRRSGRAVLDGIAVGFPAGQLTAVIGPNGAGKSTLLQVAAGLLRTDEGSVHLDGTPLHDLSRARLAAKRAFLPQNPAVEWPISVERVVALGLTAHLPTLGPLAREWQARIDATLAEFDLLPLRNRPATRLSGGELARVMLARAVVGSPELLIVDEPTAGLDPRHALDAGRRLRALADGGCTVIAAVHDLDLAARIADRALALKDGRVLAQGPAAQVLDEGTLGRLYDVRVRVLRNEGTPLIRFSLE